jgi:hypothetical protein
LGTTDQTLQPSGGTRACVRGPIGAENEVESPPQPAIASTELSNTALSNPALSAPRAPNQHVFSETLRMLIANGSFLTCVVDRT